MARPRKIVDENAILELASKGRRLNEIAAFCGISHDTLQRRYASVIERGHELMRGSLRSKQYDVAMKGNAQMLQWLGKQELGQKEKTEVTGSMKHEHYDLSHLSDAELNQVRALISSAQPDGSNLG